ncbi:pantothenate metabolism flavoprotein [Williamsoniiplasma somnilux]|uniref:Coenzyme A biosynthesis bifunctional protein CoaBC n=1 Tax=Williamsoniiplasma somnilux TaxID=215578 RepID=A0A2K8NZF7_9MOLU|nr:bifunctional phosphopantothenoylcysteine decarboxylase/phosphopantothenate--cysteine ligase CoaBC [Williamsoniiplasma somnilux]ATZ18936.1 pantothenate metabolism flavoprotein [Williamsoniiplasma somnilux]
MQRKINFIITAGIAATKAKETINKLKIDYKINVFASEDVSHFFDLETLNINTKIFTTKQYDNHATGKHIEVNKDSDLTIIYPATYDFINKVANGFADDICSLTLAANESKTLWFPSMNEKMYLNPILQKSKNTLLENKQNIWLEPKYGMLASRDLGLGRAWEPDEVVQYVNSFFEEFINLKNKKILINLGRTKAYLDPVRYITNGSSGLMGSELVKWANVFTSEISIIAGDHDVNISKITKKVNTNAEMLETMKMHFKEKDIVICSAALNDYEITNPSLIKTPKNENLNLQLSKAVDVLEHLGSLKTKQILVGFSLANDFDLIIAKTKMRKKNLDILIINLVDSMNNQKTSIKILNSINENILEFNSLTKSAAAHEIWKMINDFIKLKNQN